MSKRPVVASRINKKQLNPVFHLQTKKEDADSLSLNLIKQARNTGVLNLSGRGLANGEFFSLYITHCMIGGVSDGVDFFGILYIVCP